MMFYIPLSPLSPAHHKLPAFCKGSPLVAAAQQISHKGSIIPPTSAQHTLMRGREELSSVGTVNGGT